MDKRKTHSTQKKYFGTIPRSEFYGFVIGYAVGLIVTGFLRLQSQFQEIVFALVGLGIGYVIDKKYFQEPDEPEEAAAAETTLEAAVTAPEAVETSAAADIETASAAPAGEPAEPAAAVSVQSVQSESVGEYSESE